VNLHQDVNNVPPVSSLGQWASVSFLWLLYVLSWVDRGVISLMVSPLMHDLHVSAVQVGILQGFGFALVYSFAALPLGWAVDHLSRRRLLTAGVLVWSAGTIACGFAQGFAQLLCARAVVGLGEATLVPTALSLIADLFPPARLATPTAFFSSGPTVGLGAALILGGWLLHALANVNASDPWFVWSMPAWRTVFVIFGVLGIGVAWGCALLPEPRRLPRGTSRSATDRNATLEDFGRLLLERGLVLGSLFLAFPLLIAGGNAFVSWAPHHFETTFHWGIQRVGLVVGGMKLLASPLGVICGGLLMDRIARSGSMAPYFVIPVLSAALGAPLLAAGLVQPNAWTATWLCVLGLFIFSGFGGAHYVIVQLLAPPQLRGRLAAFYMMTISLLGTGVGAVLPPLLNSGHRDVGTSTAAAILIMTLVALAALLLGSRAAQAALMLVRSEHVVRTNG
jgi:MFS family permease